MGACDFKEISSGRTAEEAFNKAVDRARYEHGHGGYTGTIAEKHDFTMIGDTWKDVKVRYSKPLEAVTSLIREVSKAPAKSFSPGDFYNKVEKLPGWFGLTSANTKAAALERLRAKAKWLRQRRNSCKASMTGEEIASRLLHDFDDSRVSDKWGPAGCIDLDPHLSGKRKDKRFLFFGLASS